MTKPKTDLTAEFVRSILDYEPATGIFRWRFNANRPRKWNTRRAGRSAGCMVRGYLQIRIENFGCYPAHRLAWLHVHGEWPRHTIDHKNGDPSDNRIENLREATHEENSRNRRKQRNNTSGFIGVRYRTHHKKWEGRINKAGKTVWRQYFDSAQDAAAARRIAIVQIHGQFARVEGAG